MVLNTLTDRKTQFPSSCRLKKKASSDLQCTTVETLSLTCCYVHLAAKRVGLDDQARSICQ